MTARTIVKIIFLVIMTICAVISVVCGYMIERKNRESKKVVVSRKIMRVRMICFLVMLISLFVCVVI